MIGQGKPTALVTGAAGFMGSHVVRALLARSRCGVVALDDLSGGFEENLPDGVAFVRGSVTDQELVGEIFSRYKVRYVFHLAAYAAEGLSHFIRHFNYVNNVVGSINLINQSIRHEIECFVFTSSIAVYGSGENPFQEDMSPKPEDPYGIAKLAVELDLQAAHHMWGMRYVIFRPHNVYGEHQNLGDPYRNVVGIFMNQIMKGEPMTIYGDGLQERAFTYIGDVAPIIAEAPWVPEAQNQIFNAGADSPCKVVELARQVAVAMGVPGCSVAHLPPRREVYAAYCDHAKARRVFGVSAATSLHEGLARMASWARKAGVRTSKPFDRVEVARNLPKHWEGLLKRPD